MFDLYLPSGAIILSTTYPKHGMNAVADTRRIFVASVVSPYNQGQFKRMDLDLYLVEDASTPSALTFDLKNITTGVTVKQITVASGTVPDAQKHIRVTSSMTGLTFLDGQKFAWFISAAPVPCKYSANIRVTYDWATV